MLNVKRIIFEEYQRQRKFEFAWGSFDCLSFAADVAELLTGKDPAIELRGTYNSDVSAKRVMINKGWGSLAEIASSMFPEIPVAMAKSGDWVFIVNDDNTETLGVVVGAQVVARAEHGLGIQVLTKATRAFRVMDE